MSSRLDDALRTAVASVNGNDRAGQVTMAHAVDTAIRDGEHALIQAGTGTGKSLAYLVPSLLHSQRVVVATATLNLQHQLVERDIPALAANLDSGGDASYAVVKGRANYACLHRVRDGAPDEQDALIEATDGTNGGTSATGGATSDGTIGADVVRLRSWAEEQAAENGYGDREHAPEHQDSAWRHVSVSARECLGANRCPYAQECFAERARSRADEAQLVVTNHALLAIDAIDGVPMLPEHDVVVVDEGHELQSRVIQANTQDLSPVTVERAARKLRSYVDDADDLATAADSFIEAVGRLEAGRIEVLDEELRDALEAVRDSARRCMSGLAQSSSQEPDAARQQVHAMVDDVHATAARMLKHADTDVLWASDNRGARQLHIAPIDVSGSLRESLFETKTVVLTSATLKLGGRFDSVARSLGLASGDTWQALDVGSPFSYERQAILYVAAQLPSPGRDGLSAAHLDEITRLVRAAGGRTLGLFSSRRAAEDATAHLRETIDGIDIGCQGEAPLSQLSRRFAGTARASLFGTLSLWHGLDIPGDTCQLVIIDRIPFPRPDDPIMSARARHIDKQGGNGFMDVLASHAALLLAQGTGRLIRRDDDRGVVAILDSRLVTARYGSFLTASLPAMWRTSDSGTVLGALDRLNNAAHEPTTAAVQP